MKSILYLLILLIFPITANAYEVSCNGWNSDTNDWVYGECEIDGDLSGWNSETGVWVWGQCDSS